MELNSGPKIANSTCGKTIDVETIDRDSTVHNFYAEHIFKGGTVKPWYSTTLCSLQFVIVCRGWWYIHVLYNR